MITLKTGIKLKKDIKLKSSINKPQQKPYKGKIQQYAKLLKKQA